MKNLKDRGQYENLYDRMVIDICRRLEKEIPPLGDALTFNLDDIKKRHAEEKKGKVPRQTKKDIARAHLIAEYWHKSIHLYYRRVRLQERRNACIAEWMQRDKEQDEFFEGTNLTATQYCHHCNISMETKGKLLIPGSGKKEKDRILFTYQCSQCKQWRELYDNGEEVEKIESVCEQCSSKNLKHSNKRKKNDDLILQDICLDCGHTEKHVYQATKNKPIDPNYEVDRKRFCMTDYQVADWYAWVRNVESVFERRDAREKAEVPVKNTETIPRVSSFSDLHFHGLRE